MIMGKRPRQYFGLALCVALAVGLGGCDYWPPALQAQIEQLRSEIQTVTMEKSQLQTQVNELSKAKQDLYIQLDELNRVNREKSSLITSLQHQVDALRAKTVKAMAPKVSAKPAAKSTAKQPVKKTSPVKR